MESPILNAALGYLAQGYSVIPVSRESKRPLIEWKEFQVARASEAQIRGWWFTWPDANVAIITGSISGLVVVDLDKDITFDEVSTWALRYDAQETFTVKTSRGWHLYFKHPGFDVRNRAKIDGYIDARQDGGYVVAPPSVHASGFVYKVAQDYEIADMPKKLINFLAEARVNVGKVMTNGEVFQEGGRRVALLSLAGRYLKRGMSADEVYMLLLGVNQAKCQPPLKEEHIKDVVEDIYKAENRTVAGKINKLEKLKEVFAKWLYIVDPYWIELTLAAVIANRWKADPFWFLMVAPSSSAKTELIESVSTLFDTYSLSSLTPQTFISGMKDKEMSLIYKLNGKTLLLKDLTTVLSMRSDDKAIIFSQLREIYDGKFSKAFGSVKTKFWEGKIGFVGGCTGVIETQLLFNNQMGERFLIYRPELGDLDKAGDKAMDSFGLEIQMRAELKAVVNEFIEGSPRRNLHEIVVPDEMRKRFKNLARLAGTLRCGVARDGYSRDIQFRPQPEGLGRMIKQLMIAAKALCEVRGSPSVGLYEMAAMERLALSNVPGFRMDIIKTLVARGGEMNTRDLAGKITLSTNALMEHLDNMAILGLLNKKLGSGMGQVDGGIGDFGGDGRKPYVWSIKDEWTKRLAETEMFGTRLKELQEEGIGLGAGGLSNLVSDTLPL